MNRSTSGAETMTVSLRSVILPLALTQFISTYAGTSMNVAINDIAKDLGTTVNGVQTAITLFLLTMAAFMIPGSKLTDIWGRKRCLILGLTIYGIGAVVAAIAPGLGVLILGNSLLEGIGSALNIPPIYILATVLFTNLQSRARAFGIISAAAGLAAAAGPLIGGFITTAFSWRANFLVQAVVIVGIILLSRRIADPGVQGEKPAFDIRGTVLSAAGLFFVVIGILQAGDYGWFTARQDFVIGNTVIIEQGGISPVWLFVAIGAAFLLWFFLHIRSMERAGKEPLLSSRLFRNQVSNLGLITQNTQWLVLLGTSFVVSVYLQVVRGYNAIETGVIFTPATIGLLLTSLGAGRFARRRRQRTLVRVGFVMTLVGLFLLAVLVNQESRIVAFAPGLFILGMGVGLMLTSSVNIVQSAFPEEDQGEISGLSRSVSNLGSSMGTGIAGSVLVSQVSAGDTAYTYALITLGVFGLVGLVAAMRLPVDAGRVAEAEPAPETERAA